MLQEFSNELGNILSKYEMEPEFETETEEDEYV